MVGVASFISNGGDSNMSARSSAGGSGGALSLDSVSRITIGGYVSLLGGRGESIIEGGVRFPLGSSMSTNSRSVAISGVDAESGNNDGNADDVADIDDIDDGDDIGEDELLILISVIVIQQTQYSEEDPTDEGKTCHGGDSI